MRNGLLILSAVSLLSVLTACGDRPCAKAELNYRLIGFTDAEANTFTLRRLQKNSLVIKDSVAFGPSNPVNFIRFGDTLIMVAYPTTALMQSDHDYQLFFPGAARTIHVTEIIEEQSSGGDHKTQCVNEITSCKVDGSPADFFFLNGIYLQK